jgi:hypothetical protein
MADARPYLPIGATMTVGLAARIVDAYRDEIEDHFAILLGYLEESRVGVAASGINTAEQIARLAGGDPRTADEPALELAWVETTDRWGKRLYLRVWLWWELGLIAAELGVSPYAVRVRWEILYGTLSRALRKATP